MNQTEILALAKKHGALIESWMTKPPQPSLIYFEPAQLTTFAADPALSGSVPDGWTTALMELVSKYRAVNSESPAVEQDAWRAILAHVALLPASIAAPTVALPAEPVPLRTALQRLISGYVNLLETGRDMVRLSGGDSASLESLERDDHYLKEARDALSTQPPVNPAAVPEDDPFCSHMLRGVRKSYCARCQRAAAGQSNKAGIPESAKHKNPATAQASCYQDSAKSETQTGLSIAGDSRAAQAERPEPVMVDMSPPATARDRWMYEQGRLAERDPRTNAAPEPAETAALPAGYVDMLLDLLGEVSSNFTRDDDLPDNLLVRIDAAIAAKGQA